MYRYFQKISLSLCNILLALMFLERRKSMVFMVYSLSDKKEILICEGKVWRYVKLTLRMIHWRSKLSISRLIRWPPDVICSSISRLALSVESRLSRLAISELVGLSRLHTGLTTIFIWLTKPWVPWLIVHRVAELLGIPRLPWCTIEFIRPAVTRLAWQVILRRFLFDRKCFHYNSMGE